MQISPQHTVPALRHDDLTLNDSNAILLYLVDNYAKGLWGTLTEPAVPYGLWLPPLGSDPYYRIVDRLMFNATLLFRRDSDMFVSRTSSSSSEFGYLNLAKSQRCVSDHDILEQSDQHRCTSGASGSAVRCDGDVYEAPQFHGRQSCKLYDKTDITYKIKYYTTVHSDEHRRFGHHGHGDHGEHFADDGRVQVAEADRLVRRDASAFVRAHAQRAGRATPACGGGAALVTARADGNVILYGLLGIGNIYRGTSRCVLCALDAIIYLLEINILIT